MKSRIVVFAGPSGSGKNTIINELLVRCSNMSKLVTATTRAPRSNEQEGIDHLFVSEDQFKSWIESGEVLEHVHFAGSHKYYGSVKSQLEKQFDTSDVVLAEVQLVGTRFFKEYYDALTIFIQPESIEVLEERMRSRGGLSESELQKRIDNALYEIEYEAPEYDIRILNKQGRLSETIDEIVAILNHYNISCRGK